MVRKTLAVVCATGAGICFGASSEAFTSVTETNYTDQAKVRINRHHCRTEDSVMLIPARRIKDGITLPASKYPYVYCVHIDDLRRAVHN